MGQDTDLMVLLIDQCRTDNVYMLRPGAAGKSHRISNVYKLKQNLNKSVVSKILFLHAMSGCDTTFPFYKKGKKTTLTVLEKEKVLSSDLQIFISESPDTEQLLQVGENFILKWYGSVKSKNLNEYRFLKYNQVIARQNLFSNFELSTLPKTTEVAQLHIKRVYLQVQIWRGKQVIPEDWGWVKVRGCLEPQKNVKEIASDFILKFLFCGCEFGCSKSCSCKKIIINCTESCSVCVGQYCDNAIDVSLAEEDC